MFSFCLSIHDIYIYIYIHIHTHIYIYIFYIKYIMYIYIYIKQTYVSCSSSASLYSEAAADFAVAAEASLSSFCEATPLAWRGVPPVRSPEKDWWFVPRWHYIVVSIYSISINIQSIVINIHQCSSIVINIQIHALM